MGEKNTPNNNSELSKDNQGSWSSEQDGDSGKFGKVSDGEKQDDYLVGDSETGKHCHFWKEESGESGVKHRGECKVCEDNEKSSDDKSKK